jgi:adenosine deaminase
MNYEFLKKLPKTDLHMHLDGSVRIPTLIELAKESGVELPSYTEQGLRETVFKEHYRDLNQYLTGFAYTNAVMKTRDQLERISYEVAIDNQLEGVRYVEVRFAPQLHASDEMNIIECIRAVNDGLLRAKEEFNSRPEISSGAEPPFYYSIIACAMRFFTPAFSDWYRKFYEMHSFTSIDRVMALASLELEAAVAKARWEEDLPVVGIDLAGSEAGWPAFNHLDTFRRAQSHFLRKTVHAGEAYGPESIYQAITDLYAERIGHGLTLMDPTSVRSREIKDPEKYVDMLTSYIADRRITVEVCLTSNQQTNSSFRDLSNHPFRKMMEKKLSVSICTDNRTVSDTTVTNELHKAVSIFNLTRKNLKNILVYGFKRSFFPDRYDEKRQYVRRCMEYFEKVEQDYFEEESVE